MTSRKLLSLSDEIAVIFEGKLVQVAHAARHLQSSHQYAGGALHRRG